MIQIILILVAFYLLFVYQNKFYADRWNERLQIKIQFVAAEIKEGDRSKLKIVIENAKKLPLSMLMVKFQTDKYLTFDKQKGSITTDRYYHNDVFQVGGGERVTRTMEFVGVKRGFYSINNVDLTSTDLFMHGQFHDSFKPNETIYVLPRPMRCEEFLTMMKHLNGERVTRFNIFEDPFELRGIREYQSYDNMKSINWKATAKTGRFMVNQRSNTAPQNASIYLNLTTRKVFHEEDDCEAVIRIGVGLLDYLLGEGMKVGFGCNGRDLETKEYLEKELGNDINHVSVINRSLARVDLKQQPLSFRRTFASKIVTEKDIQYTCFVSCDYDQEFIDIMQELSRMGRFYIWFLASTEKVDESQIPPEVHSNMKLIRLM